MAIARCADCGKPIGASVTAPGYAETPFKPAGHPNSGLVCGKPGCENDALIWLKKDEAQEYAAGKRVFAIHTQTAKVRVS